MRALPCLAQLGELRELLKEASAPDLPPAEAEVALPLNEVNEAEPPTPDVAAPAPPLHRLGTASAPRKETGDAPSGEDRRPALAAAHAMVLAAAPAAASHTGASHAGALRTAPRAAHRATLPCAAPTGAVPTGAVPTGAVPTGAVPTGDGTPAASPGAGLPLPVGWRSATDERGRLYYYHRATKHTQWHHPGGTIGSGTQTCRCADSGGGGGGGGAGGGAGGGSGGSTSPAAPPRCGGGGVPALQLPPQRGAASSPAVSAAVSAGAAAHTPADAAAAAAATPAPTTPAAACGSGRPCGLSDGDASPCNCAERLRAAPPAVRGLLSCRSLALQPECSSQSIEVEFGDEPPGGAWRP